MKTLNIFILSKERELQLKALLDSFFKHAKIFIPVNITIFYEISNTETYYKQISYRKFLKENLSHNFIEINFSNFTTLEKYFVSDQYNLVLSDNTIFTQDFNLSYLENLHDNQILDLFKGMDRQKNSIVVDPSKYLSEAHVWKREGYLYSIEKEGLAFEQLPKITPFKYYGKIFTHNTAISFDDRKIYFYPMSPCFINAINYVDANIDFYTLPFPTEYNSYAFSIRYMCGEIIDINEICNYTPNAILDQYPHKFKKNL